MIMEEDKIIVAADLGSSQLRVIAARCNNNVVEVLAFEKENDTNNIDKGVIQSPDKLAFKLSEKCNLISNRLGPNKSVDSIYIMLGGRSISCTRVSTSKTFGTIMTVTQNDIHKLATRTHAEFFMEGKEIIQIVPQGFILDGEYFSHPIGEKCTTIEGEFLIVYCDEIIKNNIGKLFDKTGKLSLANTRLAIECSAKALLTEAQRQDGVALIDFGASTTTLAIYKDGIMRYISVIPFGGDNITHDIEVEYNVSFTSAQKLKHDIGGAIIDENNKGKTFTLKNTSVNGVKIEYDFIQAIIKARLDEIMSLCKHEIELSGLSQLLSSGVVITGDASQLKDMDTYLTDYLSMPVSFNLDILTALCNETSLAGRSASLVGLAMLADENCVTTRTVEINEPIKTGKDKASQGKSGFIQGVLSMFDN